MEPKEIGVRCAKIGLKPKQLAGLAKLHVQTVTRTIQENTSPRYETLQKMAAGVEAFELGMVKHLAALHPKAAIEVATVAMCPPDRGGRR